VSDPFGIELPPLGAVAASAGNAGGTSILKPVRLRSAGEQIAEQLVTAISLGEYVTGQRLPSERELAALLGVNRPSVREALHRLAGSGYVQIQRGRTGGAYVTNAWGPESAEMVRRTLVPNWEAFEGLFDLRRLIEPLIAQTAATRHDADEADGLVAACDAYDAADDDREASRAADQALHTAIAQATRNPYLVSLSLQIRGRVSLGFQAEPYSPTIRERAKGQHRALVEAIVRRLPAEAARIAAEHFSLTEDALRALFLRVQAVRREEEEP
jgi:DNA-binding FadR family transcriptional regulator